MKAVVIGGSGHCGSYIIPQLVQMGYEVYNISRGTREPWTSEMPEWEKVKNITADRKELMKERKFGRMIAELDPDVVVDTVAYTMEDITELCEGLMEKPAVASKVHLIQIGTIWIYGYKFEGPVTEDHVRNGNYGYGLLKAQIEAYLHNLTREGKIKATVVHPGHVSGRKWVPVNPQGNLNLNVYKDIKAGNEIILPDDGRPTLHHVHSYDIAGLICACIAQPDKSAGESFNSTTEKALTLRGFAELLYEYYGKEALFKFMPFEKFRTYVSDFDAEVSFNHVSHSPVCSMEKARNLLGFRPKYSSIETIIDFLEYYESQGLL